MTLFNRSLKVTIGTEKDAFIVNSPLTIETKIAKDITTDEPDYAQVIIYNLSPGTRDKINRKFQQIEIIGGYNGAEDLIFKAQIVTATHRKSGPDWVTTIEAGDGAKVLSQAIVNKTYTEGFKLGDIIKDVSNISDISLEGILGLDENLSLTRGKSFSATTKEILTELGNAYDFDWSIQNERLNIIKRGSNRETTKSIISARSGMVGTPEWINTGEENKKTDKKSGAKFRVVSLCIPSLRPGDTITVKSESLRGNIGGYSFDVSRPDYATDFIVSKVEHNLNNRIGDFITVIECIAIGGAT